MAEPKFYWEKESGIQAQLLVGENAQLSCDGKQMDLLQAGSVDAAQEKHVPVVEIDGDTVKVTIGSVLHPTLPEHHIEWIYLQTNLGGHRKDVRVGEDPIAYFKLVEGESAEAVFEHCNLHGLWKK